MYDVDSIQKMMWEKKECKAVKGKERATTSSRSRVEGLSRNTASGSSGLDASEGVSLGGAGDRGSRGVDEG